MKQQVLKFTASHNCGLVPAAREYLKSEGVHESALLNSDIYYNGMPLNCKYWESTTLNTGDTVEIYPNVYLITSTAVATALSVSMTVATVIAAAANFVIGMAISFAINFLIKTLFPTEQPKTPDPAPDVEALPSISGATNQIRRGSSLPLIIGTTGTSPDLAVPYYSVVEEGVQKIRHLFCVSAGYVDVWGIRKDETDIDLFEGSITYKVYNGWTGEAFQYFDDTPFVTAEDFSTRDFAKYVAESPEGCYKFAAMFSFPQGLRRENLRDGSNKSRHISVVLKFTDADGAVKNYTKKISGKAYKTSWRGYISINLGYASSWAVEIYTYRQDFPDIPANSGRGTDENIYLYLDNSITETQWFAYDPAVKYSGKSSTFIEMEAIATDKLTGGLNTINCMARLKGMQADGTLINSSNPALQARRILKDPNIIDNTEYVVIDDASFADYEAHCDKYGFTVNGIENEGRRTGEVLSDMLEIGQGYLSGASGIYEIFFDNPDNPIVDKINSRNSWGMTVAHSWNILPVDGLRISFNNADKDYQVDERLVYVDERPKNEQQISNKFISDKDLAWKYCMLNLAKESLRNAIYTFSTDWRSIDYKLGQKLQLSHPAFFLGLGTAGKVVDYVRNEQGLYVGLLLDQYYSITAGKQYILQSSTKYSMQFWDIRADESVSTNVLEFAVPITNAGILPELDTVLTLGETEKAGVDVLIRNITRNANFTAEIECLPAADIYAALLGAIPEFESSLTFPTIWGRVKPNTPKITNVHIVTDSATAIGDAVNATAKIEIKYTEKDDVEFSHYILGLRITTEGEIDDESYPTDGDVVPTDISTEFDYYTGYDKDVFNISGVFNNLSYQITLKAVSTKGIESDVATYNYEPEVLFEPLEDIETFTATIEPPDSVRFAWASVYGYAPVTYKITGDINFESQELTHLSTDLSKKVGTLDFRITATDKAGRSSENIKTASVTIAPPAMPIAATRLKTDGIFLEWQDCAMTWPIREYVVWDAYTSKQHRFNAEQLEISARPFGDYRFNLRAVDIYNNESERAEITVNIAGIAAPVPTLAISGEVLRLSWKAVSSPFPIDVYEIATSNGVLLQATKSTYYDVPPTAGGANGVVSLQVRAKDTAGNYSEYAAFSAQIDAPEAPTVTVRVHEDKRQVVVSWDKPTSDAPISAYEVSAQYAVGGLLQEKEFGTFDVNTVFLEALSSNVDNQEYTFHVRAVNYMGMVGAMGEASLQIQKLSAPQALTKSVTDNNVFLVWQEPASGSFAVKEYRVLRQEGSETQRAELFEEIGRIDSLFFGRFESKAGEYSYKIIPIDWAGVEGASATVLAFVDQPPDYTVYYDVDSTFNGTKTNFELDGKGGMIGAVVVGETWQENIDRIGQGDGLTWKQKHDLGHEYYLSPHLASGQYVEVVNVNTFIAAGRIQVTCLYETLAGTADVSCKIETSDDGLVWALSADGAWETYATGFQYVRYTITASNAMIRITELNYKVDIKLRKDNGTVFYDAVLGTSGVWVPFKTAFIDVQGAPICTVPSSTFDNPLTAYTIFEDVPNPQGFYVFVLNKNGTPTSADVTWLANGV